MRCTENDQEGGAGDGSRSESCRGAEHGQKCTNERTGAVTGRATRAMRQREQASQNGHPYEM
jgi:hypothetical protein